LGFALIACNPAPPTPTPIPLEGSDLYTDSLVGFRFRYPTGWDIYPPITDDPYAYTFAVVSKDYSADPNGQFIGGKIEGTVYPPEVTIESLIAQNETLGPERRETRRLPSGQDATLFVIKDRFDDEFYVLVVELRDRTVGFTATGDFAFFEIMLNTLQTD
jgi:hypothetical protein